MKLPRNSILEHLQELERTNGGFTGELLTRFATTHGLHPIAFNRRVFRLLQVDPRFRSLHYLGKRRPSLVLDDYAWLTDTLEEAPLSATASLVSGLNQRRTDTGLPPLPERTLQRVVEELTVGMDRERVDPLVWFSHAGLPVSSSYTVSAARDALDAHFTYRDLGTRQGISLRQTLARLQAAEAWFQTHHPGAIPHDHYDRLRPRAVALPGFLASLAMDRAPGIQGRLVFELMAVFLVEARDFLLTNCRFRVDRFQQAVNASLKAVQCQLLETRVADTKAVLRRELDRPSGPDRAELTVLATKPDRELDRAKALLRLRRGDAYLRILDHLAALTGGFNPGKVRPWGFRADVLLRLARGEVSWDTLPGAAQTALGKNRRLLEVVEAPRREELLRILLVERLLHYLKRGKLTLSRSWEFQDLGRLITSAPPLLLEEDWPLSRAVLEELISERYSVDLKPLREAVDRPFPGSGDEDGAEALFDREDFSSVAREVHQVVLEENPDWFDGHRRTLEKVWEGCFRMEYSEETFSDRLREAIGFLGRNCRVRDDPGFRRLEHFLRRYVTPATLELELRYIHRTLAALTGAREEVLLTDTIGIEGRRTHALATYHPRYHTQGLSDLRGIGGRLVPATSLACSARETEAMHAVELVARANRVLDGGLRILSGNGHTVSKVSAGLLFGTFGVVSAGHVPTVPALPSPGRLEALRKGLPVMNRVFALLRERPELGRLFCTRSHIYVENMNVRGLVESLGCLVLRAVDRQGFPVRDVQPLIEMSNRMKRIVRIFERGVVRAQPHHQVLHLLSGEIILGIAAIRGCLRREGSAIGYPMIDLDSIALFKPA